MEFLDKFSRLLNQTLLWFAGVFLVGMILLTCSNIFLRIVWIPVRGTFEIMGFLGATATAFALGYTQMKKGHIAIDILVCSFSKKTQGILNGINYLILAIFFAVVSWQISKYATTLLKSGEVTETLRIIYYPFTYGVALGCAALSLVFLVDFFKSVLPRKEDEE
ncbi:MAG: TRAP transporter small permease [Thermodesulfobacteriota bacterium]|nr:TRAP transporter small permease [Thermodesulfobacteriota bacterium]